MYKKDKIGVGILTKNNEDAFNACFKSLPDYITPYACIVNSEYKDIPSIRHHIYSKDVCEAWSKNNLLRMMINDECEHLFILKDNTAIQNKNIFNDYINAATKSGIWYLQFNENQKPKNSIAYDNVSISFSNEVCDNFFYIHRGVIKNIGFYDERYSFGYLEQTDLIYRLYKKNLLPGWGWFADLENSNSYISSVYNTLQLNKQKEYFEKTWFTFKNKTKPNEIPVTSESEVLKNLEKIKSQYAKQQ